MRLVVSSPPFVKKESTTRTVLWSVVIALLPAVMASLYLFRIQGLMVLLACVAGTTITEWAINRSKMDMALRGGTGLITALILALLLPFNTPLWIPFIGGVFSIAIVKEAFGGHGSNIFNPAIAGWVFLMISWANYTLTPPVRYEGLNNLILNPQAIRLVEASPAAVLLGGALLFLTRLIKLDVPIGFIAALIPGLYLFNIPLTRTLNGIFFLMIFFVITDPVTSPITKRGRLYFGGANAFLAALYGVFGNFEEGLGLALLLMNALVPLIDRFTRPRPILLEGMKDV